MGASIHIQKSVVGSVGHNSRTHFSYSVVFTDEKNELDNSKEEAYKIYRSELKERSEKYTERTGQRLQKNTVTQLSAVVNLEQHHTLQDLAPIKEQLEKKFGTKVFQMSIHRDEGKLISKEDGTELYSGKDFFLNMEDNQLYFDKKFKKPVPMKDYEIKKNYHAHMEMLGLDEDGKAIRQKMSKGALRELQDITADTLGMQRGQKTKSYTQEQMKEIIDIVGSKADYESTTIYAQKFNEVAKELGYYQEKTKRKDTHKFKDDGAERESAKRVELAKVKDLKEQMKELRAELKESGAVREDYAKLEQLNKELKEQIKGKDLTIEQLQEKLEGYQKSARDSMSLASTRLQMLKSQSELVDIRNVEIEEYKTDKTELESTVDSLKSKNSSLEEELVEKQKEIDSKPNESEIQTYIEEELEVKLKKNGKPKQFGLKSLIAYLVDKVKDFKEQIKELTAENKGLKAQNEMLKATVELHNERPEVDDWWNKQMAKSTEFGKPTENSNKIDEIIQTQTKSKIHKNR